MALVPASDPVADAKRLFTATFGGEPTVGAEAPGRVNLIGEHTDYCDGFVFPMALERTTVMVGRPNGSSKCRIVTASKLGDSSEVAEFAVSNASLCKGEPVWANYVKGVMKQLPQLPGFDAAIATSVPIGGGLSSSAALEVATHTFCDLMLKGDSPNNKEKALRCQKAEHTFADMPCGIMDQYISTCGEKGGALLIDCRSLDARVVRISNPDLVVFIANSNVTHKLSDSEYPKRKASCVAAVQAIASKFSGVTSLREATMQQLDAVNKEGLIDSVTYRRARHVIGETARCEEAESAFQRGDFQRFGDLMVESHISLRDDYEVSCPELNKLQEIAMTVPGVYGSRMTGGGFGGCTVTLAHKSCKDELLAAISKGYPKASCFFTLPGAGARAVPLSSASKTEEANCVSMFEVVAILGVAAAVGYYLSKK